MSQAGLQDIRVPGYIRPPLGRFRRPWIVAFTVTLLVVVGFVAFEFHFTTVDITVASHHVADTVTFTLTFDGEQIDAGALPPMQETSVRVPLAAWFVECQPHSIAAVSTGGESGPTADPTNPLVCADTSWGIALSV